MIGAILLVLAKANLAAGAGVVLVLALRKLVRPWFGARAAYALWLAPLAAAVAVLAPHPQVLTPLSPIVLSAQSAAAEVFVAQAPAASRAGAPDVGTLLFAAWLAGTLMAGGLVLWRQTRFTAAMGRLTPSDSPRLFRAEHPGVGPAVVGVFRPRIVAPADFEARFGPEERTLILTHERVHLAGGDAAINALACAIQCLCWFNPLAHLGVRALRIDQELACDATVIGRFPQARRAYAELLLKTQITTQALPLGCHWPARAEHPLKERIAMLKSPLPELSMRIVGLAVAGMLTLGAGGLAWAAQPGPGAAQRLAAEADAALHPNYTCDPAGAARGEGGCNIIRTSAWVALPTHADIMRAYPPAALKAGMTAEVQISCALSVGGLLKSCAPVETAVKAPSGVTVSDDARAQFGRAAVAVSRYYQARLREPLPHPWNGHAILPVFFSPTAIPGSPGMPGAIPARAMPPLPAPTASTRTSEAGTPARKLLAAFATPAAPNLIGSPDWAEKPGPQDVAKVYPAADQDGMGGQAVLDCRFAADGGLAGCKVASETPSEDGFGAAALKLAPLFRAKPLSHDGAQVAGQAVRIPLRFVGANAGLVTPPDWIEKPTGADLARFYPPEAAKQNFEGTTALSCGVDRDGRLVGCAATPLTTFGAPEAIREDFRKATLELAGLFRMRPQSLDGAPMAGGRVNIPIRWSLPTDPGAKARLDALKG